MRRGRRVGECRRRRSARCLIPAARTRAAPSGCGQPRRERVHAELARGRAPAGAVGRPVGRALPRRPGAASRCRRKRAQLVRLLGQRLRDARAQRRRRRRARPRACRARASSAAAVLAPTPRAPGRPSEGSPRSAIRSGIWAGSTPLRSRTPAASIVPGGPSRRSSITLVCVVDGLVEVAVGGADQRVPAGRRPRRARSDPSRSSASSVRCAATVQPNAASSAGARSHCARSSSGIGSRWAW